MDIKKLEAHEVPFNNWPSALLMERDSTGSEIALLWYYHSNPLVQTPGQNCVTTVQLIIL